MKKNKRIRILVTGGTGFIGSALVRRLVQEGFKVRVLDNNSRGGSERLSDVSDEIEFCRADIRDAGKVSRACKGVDCIFHLAYVNGTEFFYSKPELVLDVGVKGMMNVLDACASHRIREMVLVSSSEVYQTPPYVPTDEKVPLSVPDPYNPRYSYGGGKIISELLLINYGRKYFDRAQIIRPHNVYGPDMGWEHVIPQFSLRLMDLIRNDSGKAGTALGFGIQGSGRETRAFIYIDDFVDGFMAVYGKGEKHSIYNIGTMDEISVANLARKVAAVAGRRIRIIPGELQKGGTPRRCPDTAKSGKLGFRPGISMEEGLQRTFSWYRVNSPARSAGRE
ncbi:MAG: SDR family NAD(P)-dependent oxidoreductase [Victivallales bacterium]